MIIKKTPSPEPSSKTAADEGTATPQPGSGQTLAPIAATIDQQIEQHALSIERVQREAVFDIGRELAAAQDLFKYSRQEGGFTGWLERRLPQMSERSAYNAINIYKNVDPAMFAKFANFPKPGALAEVAKAPPDIQALIAERVEAGEVFTAAKVKEIRAEATADAAESAAVEIEDANKQIAALEAKLVDAGANAQELGNQIDHLKAAVKEHEEEIDEYQRSLLTPKEAEKKAAQGEGVVLGSDGKFHSGATKVQKELAADYMTVWALLSALTKKDRPLAERVAAGCAPQHRKQLLGFIHDTITYVTMIKEGVNAAPKDQA